MIGWLLLAALALPQQDTVGVAVQLSRERVGTGEVVLYEVTVTTPGGTPDDVRLPRLPGALQIVSTRRFDQYAIRFPGGRVRTTRVELRLRARAPGRYAIPPAVVVHEGRRYVSRPLTLEVVDAGRALAPAAPSSQAPGFTRGAVGPDAEAMVRARLEPDTVYVGEQATLEVDALISDDLRRRLRRAPEYLSPSLSGVWSHDLPGVRGARVEWSAGRRYEVQTFRRALFPLEPGEVEIPPARLVYEARRGFLFTPYTGELETPALTLHVEALPEDGVPDSFTGAVGDFSVTATISPAALAVGDAALLSVVVSGRGNIKALPAPHIDAPPSLQLDAPTEDSEESAAGGLVAGRKTFTWVVVPERPGTIDLGPVEYGFFDPAAGEYRVAASTPLRLQVTGAAVAVDEDGRSATTLRPLRAWPRPDPFGFLRGWLLGFLAAAPVAALGLVLARGRRRGREAGAPSRRTLRRRLNDALDELGRSEQRLEPSFFVRLEDAVRAWLADRLAAAELRKASPQTMAAALEAREVAPALASAIADQLGRIGRAPYQPTPPGDDERTRMLVRMRELLERLDRTAPVPGRGGPWYRRLPWLPRVAVVLLVPLTLAAAEHQSGPTATRPDSPGQATPSLASIAGAYAERRLDAAADAARDYVRANPGDASGWYDLGTVEAARDNRGVAAWALLRALALDPRASDIRHNLDYLAVAPETRRAVAPLVPLRPGEVRALALLAWWVALGLGWLALRRRSRRMTMAAAVALGVTLVFGGLAVAPRLLPPLALLLRPTAELRAGPHLRAATLGRLGEAVPMRVVDRRDGWVRVRTAEGGEGWLERRDVGIIPGA